MYAISLDAVQTWLNCTRYPTSHEHCLFLNSLPASQLAIECRKIYNQMITINNVKNNTLYVHIYSVDAIYTYRINDNDTP